MERSGPAASRSSGAGLLAGALLLLTLCAYARAGTLGFTQYDDGLYVASNPIVLRGLSLEGLRYAFTTTELANWHPLTWLSHMAVAEAFGAAAPAHHAANVLLHGACVVLLFVVLVRATGQRLPAAFAAALLAVHPLHVESVAWVAERKDVLSTLFWLLALLAWVRYARGGGARWYGATLLAFAAGLMSKPMLVTLPFTLVLLDVWPLGRWKGAGGTLSALALLREKLPMLVLAALGSALAFAVQSQAGAMEYGHELGLATRAANAVRSVGVYLLQTFWPARLAVHYPYELPLPLAQTLASAAAVAALSALALWRFRQAPWWLVGWLWFLGTLVPVLGLVQVGSQAHADRYTYVPHIGLFVALAGGLAQLGARARIPRQVGFSAAVIALGVLTWRTQAQVGVWRDEETLFRHALAVRPSSALAHDHLAQELQRQGRHDEALAHFRRFAELEPRLASAHVNLGTALERRGDLQAARGSYERALALDPRSDLACSNLGALLARERRFDEAAPLFERAVELAPHKAGLRLNAASNALFREHAEDARRHFRAAVELDPELAAEHPQALRLAWLLASAPGPDAAEARAALLAAEALDRKRGGRDPGVHEILAGALAANGRFEDALRVAQAALAAARTSAPPEVVARLEAACTRYASGRPPETP